MSSVDIVFGRVAGEKESAPPFAKEPASDGVAIAAITLRELSWLATFVRIDPGGASPAF
jgi:hypothetical protein